MRIRFINGLLLNLSVYKKTMQKYSFCIKINERVTYERKIRCIIGK